jgi:hypothetical protein
MRTSNNWIAMVLVAVLVGMASRPAHAEGTSIASPLLPLSPRYLPQTLAPVEPGGARVHGTLRHAQVALPGPGTRLTGSHASLKAWMWAGVVVGALVVVAVLTIPRD